MAATPEIDGPAGRMLPVLPVDPGKRSQGEVESLGSVALVSLGYQGDIQLMGQRQSGHR